MSVEQGGGQSEPDLARQWVVSNLGELYRENACIPVDTPDGLEAVIAGSLPSDRDVDKDALWGVTVRNYVAGGNPHYGIDIIHADLKTGQPLRWTTTYNAGDLGQGATTAEEDRRMRMLLESATFTEEAAIAAAGKLTRASIRTLSVGNISVDEDLQTRVKQMQTEHLRTQGGNIVARGLFRIFPFLRRRTHND